MITLQEYDLEIKPKKIVRGQVCNLSMEEQDRKDHVENELLDYERFIERS